MTNETNETNKTNETNRTNKTNKTDKSNRAQALPYYWLHAVTAQIFVAAGEVVVAKPAATIS